MDTEAEQSEEQPVPETVKIKLDGAGYPLDREIDIEAALDVVNVVLGGMDRGRSESKGSGSGSRRRRASVKGMSVGEFIANSGASTNPEKIVAIGAWLEDEGLDSFTTSQVKEQFQKAK
ncbi:MAG: hypothetical protein ACRDVL_10500, partial [Acidimicrobiia bacterium]